MTTYRKYIRFLATCSIAVSLATCARANAPTSTCPIIIDHPQPLSAVAWQVPIESADEALSYALAKTGYRARYDWPFCNSVYANYIALTEQVEDTHVDQIKGGYRVYLFDEDPINGIESVVVDVARDGSISHHETQRIARPI